MTLERRRNESALRYWIRWFFLPHDGIVQYTLRAGLLWYGPAMALGSHLSCLTFGDGCSFSLHRFAVAALILGLVHGICGYPVFRWAMTVDERRYRRSNHGASV